MDREGLAKGMLLGCIVGSLIGLFFWLRLDVVWLFEGNAVLAGLIVGSVVGALLGYSFGDDLFEAVADYWPRWWW